MSKRRSESVPLSGESAAVIGSYDTVVCGGGPAGVMAAVASARTGARTLLIERYGFLGGMATAAMVGPLSKFRLGGALIVGGIPWQFVQRMHQRGGAIIDLPSGNVPFEVETYIRVARELVEEEGVETLLHALVTGAVMDESDPERLTHVIVETKQGKLAVGAKVAIDCTGSGDLVARSELPWKLRVGPSGELQPLSMFFHLGGVDTGARNLLMSHDGTKYRDSELGRHLHAAMERGEIGNYGGPWALWGSTIRPGYVSVLATRYAGNATDAAELTRAETVMRSEIPKIVEILRQNAPEFSGCFLDRTATQAGIRETRGIDGAYTLSPTDVLEPQGFSDTIAKGGHPVDIHLPTVGGENEVRFIKEPYDIPYRCLLPKGAANVLAAGGCLSAEREAFATVRVQAQCMATGQAAGTAAAMCARESLRVDQLDGSDLRRLLRSHGAIV